MTFALGFAYGAAIALAAVAAVFVGVVAEMVRIADKYEPDIW